MGRSKKNWDHLVDFYGNYGIDIANGLFPGSGNAPGVKGNKGEVGFDGPKGEQGIKGEKGIRGIGQKGETGDGGATGEKGQKGEARGLLTFKGSVANEGALPNDALPGDVYLQTDTNELRVWTGTEWEALGLATSVKGEKGEEGDLGQKGEPGDDGNPGAGGPEGEKGEKGDNFDPVVLDDYLDKGQVEGLIEHFASPEFAFNINYYEDATSIVSNETVDFNSNDQQDEVYNPGIVHIEPNCTIVNSPLPDARQIVVNYVIDDAGRARGLGYQMIQHLYSPDVDHGEVDAYYRVVRPGQSEFGDWRPIHFDADRYYTKIELDARIGDQELTLIDGVVENTETIGLLDSNGVIGPSVVRIHTQGGITLTRNSNTLTFDGSPLAGQLQFLGLIEVDEDVTAIQPSPSPGQYFIFKNSGTDVNTGEDVQAGDWLIYGADPTEWRHLPMGVNYGVAEVRIKPDKPYLTQTGTIQFPEIGFDTVDFETDFPGREGGIDILNESILNHHDVKTDFVGLGMYVYDSRQPWNATLTQGQYAVNVAENKIRLATRDKNNGPTQSLADNLENAGYFCTLSGSNRPTRKTVIGRMESHNPAVDGITFEWKERGAPIYAGGPQVGELTFEVHPDYNIADGKSLVWNNTEGRFITAIAGDGRFVEKAGDTMEGDLNTDGNDINGLPNPPPTDSSAASKEWVLSLLGGLVQPGMVVFWPSSASTPSGWKKMDGGGYNVGNNPKMHAVLQGMEGFVSGKMPDWRGRFIYHTQGNSTADVNGGKAGHLAEQRTADSSSGIRTRAGDGTHRHKWVRQNGKGAGTSTGSHVLRDKTSGAGNSTVTYYTDNNDVGTDGRHVHNIDGWDAKTRPDAVAGYWIMKLD